MEIRETGFMQPKSGSSRPVGVTILGILAILIGLLGALGGALLLTSSDAVVVALSTFAVVVGLLYLTTGIGFFRGDRWAWTLGLAVSILALIRNLVEAITGGFVFSIPGIIVALIIIYYLTRQPVRAHFSQERA